LLDRLLKAGAVLALLALAGCAAQGSALEPTSAKQRYNELAARQLESTTSYAALLRTKLKRGRRVDDFRVEIFSRKPDQLSLYVRGFLGSAVFKSVVNGDTLICYFPRENRYYRGEVADLESGALKDSRHIIELLLAFYRGSYELSDDPVWHSRIKSKGKGYELTSVDTLHSLKFESFLKYSIGEYPYLSAESIRLISADRSFLTNVAVQSRSFNREIPAEKFVIEIPPTAMLMTREDLADLLTNLAQ
jgi:hypothetical protein